MKKNTRLIVVLLTLFVSILTVQARKWVVSDETLTVWSTANYIGELGKLHRGDVIEELEIAEGDKIKFNYNGKTGYVSSNCCKVMNEEEAQDIDTSNGVGRVAEIEGNRYKVISETSIPIFAADGSNKTIGHLWKDDEIDATGFSTDERFLLFSYKGQDAMVSAAYFKHIPIAKDADGNPLPPQVPSDKPKNEGNIPLAIGILVVGAIAFIPLLLIQVVAWGNLLFFVFGYQRLRRFYNKRAGNDFMPAKRMSRLLLKGLIPLGIVAVITLGGTILLNSLQLDLGDVGSIMPNIFGLFGVVVAAIYVIGFAIPHRAKVVGKRQAKWETIYSVLTLAVLIPVAIWLFNVMLVLLVAIPLCLFILNYVLPGAFASAGGAIGSAASGAAGAASNGNPGTCSTCGCYGNYCDPANIDDPMHNSCSNYKPKN